MEAHEPFAVEPPDSETFAPSPGVASASAVDPLTDASCLRCGYSLRGLTENRCPECGAPFDRQEMTGGYLPEWPRLMVWFLTAACLTGLLQVLMQALWIVSLQRPILFLMQDRQSVLFLFDFATMILIAPFAIIGLRRRIDWGRKLVIGLCVVQSLPLLPVAFMMAFNLVSAAWSDELDLRWTIWYARPALLLGSQLSVPALVLACILLNRLGRRSLRRSASDALLLLPQKAFPPRNDWLLMLVVLLVVGLRAHFGYFGETALQMIWLFALAPGFGAPWWEQVGSTTARALLLVAQLGWLAWTVQAIWRNPTSTRRYLRTFVIVFIASVVAGEIIKLLFMTSWGFFPSVGTGACYISSTLAYVLACLSIPLALYLYASRTLPDEAIARVVGPQEQTAGPTAASPAACSG